MSRLRTPARAVPLVAAAVVLAGLALVLPGAAATTGPVPSAPATPAASAHPVPRTALAPDEVPAAVQADEGPAAPPAPAALPPGLTAADVAAGLLSSDVPQVGAGTSTSVPGSVPAPGPGRVWSVRVEVEDGVPVDGPAFAAFVVETLNDPRGWSRDGVSFARTDGEADVVVLLASPDTSAARCRPLRTGGTLSCRTGDHVVLTHHRWVLAHPDYGDDRTGYRRYLVNHEVGHFLGHGHVACPGPGLPAPVMMQQTKGLDGCAPNSWPYQ